MPSLKAEKLKNQSCSNKWWYELLVPVIDAMTIKLQSLHAGNNNLLDRFLW